MREHLPNPSFADRVRDLHDVADESGHAVRRAYEAEIERLKKELHRAWDQESYWKQAAEHWKTVANRVIGRAS